jgi:hypothetical protein
MSLAKGFEKEKKSRKRSLISVKKSEMFCMGIWCGFKVGCVPLDPLERTGTRPTSTEIPMIPKVCPLLGALFYDSDGSSGTHS